MIIDIVTNSKIWFYFFLKPRLLSQSVLFFICLSESFYRTRKTKNSKIYVATFCLKSIKHFLNN